MMRYLILRRRPVSDDDLFTEKVGGGGPDLEFPFQGEVLRSCGTTMLVSFDVTQMLNCWSNQFLSH